MDEPMEYEDYLDEWMEFYNDLKEYCRNSGMYIRDENALRPYREVLKAMRNFESRKSDDYQSFIADTYAHIGAKWPDCEDEARSIGYQNIERFILVFIGKSCLTCKFRKDKDSADPLGRACDGCQEHLHWAPDNNE